MLGREITDVIQGEGSIINFKHSKLGNGMGTWRRKVVQASCFVV